MTYQNTLGLILKYKLPSFMIIKILHNLQSHNGCLVSIVSLNGWLVPRISLMKRASAIESPGSFLE